jgi:hypothetical protein
MLHHFQHSPHKQRTATRLEGGAQLEARRVLTLPLVALLSIRLSIWAILAVFEQRVDYCVICYK